jgi:hypothetical protein
MAYKIAQVWLQCFSQQHYLFADDSFIVFRPEMVKCFPQGNVPQLTFLSLIDIVLANL